MNQKRNQKKEPKKETRKEPEKEPEEKENKQKKKPFFAPKITQKIEKPKSIILTKDKIIFNYFENDEEIKVQLIQENDLITNDKRGGKIIFCKAVTERMEDKWKEKYSIWTTYCDKFFLCIQKLNYTLNIDEYYSDGDPFEFQTFTREKIGDFVDLKQFLKEQIALAKQTYI